MADLSCNLIFRWQIENFSVLLLKRHEALVSPTFKHFEPQESTWFVVLCLKNCDSSAESLYVKLENEEETINLKFDWEYSFLDADERPIFSHTIRNHDFSRVRGLQNDSLNCEQYPGPTFEEIFVTKRFKYLQGDTLTLRLRLWPSEEPLTVLPVMDKFVSTRSVSGMESVCNKWDIEGFSRLQLNGKVDNFLLFDIFGDCFTIALSLEGSSLEASAVKLQLTPHDSSGMLMFCEISVLDQDLKCQETLKLQHAFNERDDNQTWIFPTILTREEILNKNYLHGDDLSLLLNFHVPTCFHVETICFSPSYLLKRLGNTRGLRVSESSNRTSESNVNHSNIPKQNYDSENILSQCFSSLYQKKTFCDFELRSGDESFPVHKVVLSARSPVFQNMLTSEVTDSNFYDVKDLDGTTLNLLLTFLYGGGVRPDLHWEGAAKLFSAAVKYEVPSLKQQCSSILQSRISTQNACKILLLSHENDDEELKSFVHDFLFKNMDEVVSSAEWNEFQEQNLQIANITMRRLLDLTVIMRRSIIL